MTRLILSSVIFLFGSSIVFSPAVSYAHIFPTKTQVFISSPAVLFSPSPRLVLGTEGTTLIAKNDLQIGAAENTFSESHYKKETYSNSLNTVLAIVAPVAAGMMGGSEGLIGRSK